MERYNAVEYLFDCLAVLVPSWEETVFCLETGSCDEDEDVETLDNWGIMTAAMAIKRLKSTRCDNFDFLKAAYALSMLGSRSFA